MKFGKYKWILANIIVICGFLAIPIWDIVFNFDLDSIYKMASRVSNEAETIVDSIKSPSFEDFLKFIFCGDFSEDSLMKTLFGVDLYNISMLLTNQIKDIFEAAQKLISFFLCDILIGFVLTFVLGVISFVLFIKSITNLKKNQEKSVCNSKKSIKFAAIIYACQILCVLIFNIYSELNGVELLSYVKLIFPFGTFIFLIICIALLKSTQLVRVISDYTSSVPLNTTVSNEFDWYCTKCGNGNRNDSMFCVYCGMAQSVCSTDNDITQKETFDNTSLAASVANDDEKMWHCSACGKDNAVSYLFCVNCGEAQSVCSADNDITQKETLNNTSLVASVAKEDEKIWYCSACGKDNAVSYLFCVNCGKAKENNSQGATLLTKDVVDKVKNVASNVSKSVIDASQGVTLFAKDAVDKVKNVASNIPKPAIDVKGIADKMKNATSNISLPSFNSKNDFEKIKLLKELLDMGAITQEEFDKKKSEILKL